MRSRGVLLLIATMVFWCGPALAQDYAATPAACSSPKAHQFDFWVGQWEVTANDTIAGYNSIAPILDGCVLLEEYSGANTSYSGKSFNYYDAADDSWHQVWVDNSGLRLNLKGAFADGKMVMSGERVVNGQRITDRITWSANADGTVRQLWEASRDNGKTWGTLFDGLYNKM